LPFVNFTKLPTMRKCLFFVFFVLFCVSNINAQTAAQQKKISQIEKKIESAASNIEKIEFLNQLAEIYLEISAEKSIEYAEQALKLLKKESNVKPVTEANLYSTLGAAYYYQEKMSKAIKYYEKEYGVIEKNGTRDQKIRSLFNLATISLQNKDYKDAKKSYEKSLELAKQGNSKDLIAYHYKALYDVNFKWGKYEEALKYYDLYISIRDSELRRDLQKKISVLTTQFVFEKRKRIEKEKESLQKDEIIYEANENQARLRGDTAKLREDSIKKSQEIRLLNAEKELQDKKIELQNVQLEKRARTILLLAIVGLIIAVAAFWLYRLYRQKKIINQILAQQKEEIQAQAELLEENNLQLEEQKNLLEERNAQIMDSINYAKRIQEAILIPEYEIQKHFPEFFIYYQPKDIVSGDFYWFAQVENKYVLAAIDCTGHGVPGAFMSMIGNTLLNEIVNEKHITAPNEILANLHTGVAKALQQNRPKKDGKYVVEDGMDMTLCTIDAKQKRFQFAGARNHLYVVQGTELKVLKANTFSIGGSSTTQNEFTMYDFMYDDKTSIYMLSDGYLDQFGGEQDIKFNTSRFKQMLIENRDANMRQQKQIVAETMQEWKGENEQIDDMLVIGLRLN